MESGLIQYKREALIDLLGREALRQGTFTLASGRTSHYYVDGRKVTLSARGGALVAAGVLEQIAKCPGVNAVGGLTMGADPIVGASLGLAPSFGLGHLVGFLVPKEKKLTAPGTWSRGHSSLDRRW